MKRTNRTSVALFAGITLSALITLAPAGCSIFGENYEPGEQMGDGVWYAECDFGLGDRTVKGILDDSDMVWTEPYANEFHFSLVRRYDDGTEVDLLADVRDQNDMLRMACHEEENTFLLTGLPSWAKTADSYVVGEIVTYPGASNGDVEGYRVRYPFNTDERSEQKTLDIGTHKVKPVNEAYSVTFDLQYMYMGTGTQYTEKTYDELTTLGFSLSGGDSAWFEGTGAGSYALLLHNVTNAEVQAGQVVITNQIGGGTYDVSVSIMVDGEVVGFPSSGPPYRLTIDDENPTPVVEAPIYVD